MCAENLLLLQIGVQSVLIIKQRYDQHLDEVKLSGFKILPSEEEEGRLTRASI